MTKPQSGYYYHSGINNYLAFYGTHLYVSELSPDTSLVCPALFHQIASDVDSREECVTYFKEDNPLLHDLHFMFDIRGLYDH